MPKVTNTFLIPRMDSDTNASFLDNKSYSYLLNMRPTGYGDNGTLRFIKGSELVVDYSENGTLESVKLFEGNNNKIYNFLTRADGLSRIVETDAITRASRIIIEDSTVLRFDFLRYQNGIPKPEKEYLNSVSQVDQFIIFSSRHWRYPRIINLNRIADYAGGFTEEDISLVKKPPFEAPKIIARTKDLTIEDKNLGNMFVSFSCRYKYVDDDYSSLSAYTEASFVPQKWTSFQIDGKRKNLGMENPYNKVSLQVNSGGKNVTDIEVYAREHGSNTAYLIYRSNKSQAGITDNSTIIIEYAYSKKYQVLDEQSTNMLYSNCPMFPNAQANVGNRMIYGNFEEGFDLKDKDGHDVKVDYDVLKIQNAYDPNVPERNKTAVSLFSYKVAPVFLNDYDITTSNLLPTDQKKAEIPINFSDRTFANHLQVKFASGFTMPSFATKVRFGVTSQKLTYENIYITYAKKTGKYTYLQLSNDNINRVKKGDTLIVVSTTETQYNEIYVEDVGEFDSSVGVETKGIYIKIKDDDNVIDLTPNGTSITKNYLEHQNGGVGEYEDYVWGIDFVYGSNDTRRFDATSGYAGVNTDVAANWAYASVNNRGHLLKSDFGIIKEGDVLKLNLNFEYMWKKSGGTFSTNGLGNVHLSKDLYASRDYANVYEFLQNEYDEALITVQEDNDKVWFLTNYLFPNFVKNSGIGAYSWAPNDGGGNASEALAVKPSTNVTLLRGIKPVILRTKQSDISDYGDSNGLIYYETDKTYPIVNGQVVPDSWDGSRPVFDINFYNGYTWGNGIESYKIRDEFNGKILNQNFRPNTYDINGYGKKRKSNHLTYSNLYNQEMKINGLPTFNPITVNWKALPTEHGEITKLISTDGDLKVFCIDKVINQYYGKSVIADLQGNESVAMSTEVLGSIYELPYKFGCQNPESVIFANNLIYFTDKKRTRILATADKEIIELNSTDMGFLQEGVDQIMAHNTFPAAYDYRFGDYILGLEHKQSVVFNFTQKGFSHYYNHQFDYKLGIAGKIFTCYKGVLFEDEVTADYNNFAGQGNFEAVVKFVVNPEMATDKIYNAISIQSNTPWNTEVKTNLTATKFTENVYNKRESYYYTEVFRDSSTPLGVVGIGRIKSIDGNDLVFNSPISNQVTANDRLVNIAGSVNQNITKISGVTITVGNPSGLNPGDFVGVQKGQIGDYRPNGVPIRGDYMEVTLRKSGSQPYYITSVNTLIIPSEPA